MFMNRYVKQANAYVVMHPYRTESAALSSLIVPTFALESRNKIDSDLAAEWWTKFTVHTKTPHTHGSSQFCRQELWWSFPYTYSIRLSRAKVGAIEDDMEGNFHSIKEHEVKADLDAGDVWPVSWLLWPAALHQLSQLLLRKGDLFTAGSQLLPKEIAGYLKD